MDYAWRTYRFDLPAGLDDESVLTFLSRKGGAVDLNVTISRDHLTAKLDRYLADSVEQMKKQLSGYRLVERTTRAVAGKDAVVLEHGTTAKDGAALRMVQAYVPADGEVLIVTATGPEAERARLLATFDAVVGSLRPAP